MLRRRGACRSRCCLCSRSSCRWPPRQPVPPRTEVAIREVVPSDGTERYAVPIPIGRTRFDAGLDTGSSGLRGDRRRGRAVDRSSRFDRFRRRAATRRGDRRGRRHGRHDQRQRAPATRRSGRLCAGPRRLRRRSHRRRRLRHPGATDRRAKASRRSSDSTPPTRACRRSSPPSASGAGSSSCRGPVKVAPAVSCRTRTTTRRAGSCRWPRRRPSASARGGLHDAVDGCVVNQSSRRSCCGAVLLDTGAPGTPSRRPMRAGRWVSDTPAVRSFVRGGTSVAAAPFVTDRRDQASRFTPRDDHERPAAVRDRPCATPACCRASPGRCCMTRTGARSPSTATADEGRAGRRVAALKVGDQGCDALRDGIQGPCSSSCASTASAAGQPARRRLSSRRRPAGPCDAIDPSPRPLAAA